MFVHLHRRSVPSKSTLGLLTSAAVISTALFGCGGTGTPAKDPAPTAEAAPESATADPLFEALMAIERSPPPIDALPDWAKERVTETFRALAAPEQALVREGKEPAVSTHPLLHWAGGGNSLDVYAACVDGSVASDDWVGLAQTRPDQVSARELVEVGNELSRRAALTLLRERAADFAPQREPSDTALAHVVSAATLLELDTVTRLALKRQAQLDPSPEAVLRVLYSHARALDLPAAEATFAELEADARVTKEVLERARQLVETTRLASGSGPHTGNAIARARALNQLGQSERAEELLSKLATPGLAHATELIRARLGDGICPGVLQQNPLLCRAAFAMRANDLKLQASLDDAWRSGAGRDTRAVEHFLGLRFVAALTYQQALDGSNLTADAFVSTLDALKQHAEQASNVDSRFAALALISETLQQAVLATALGPEEPRPLIPVATRKALRDRALAALDVATEKRWSRAAALAALAVSVQDDPIGAELQRLQGDLLPAQYPTLGALELWTALADHDTARFDRLRDLVVAIAENTDVKGVERTEWLLTWSEAEAHLFPGEPTFTTLGKLCEPLLAPEIPLSLRLRAHLNRAGMMARLGQTENAITELSRVVQSVPRNSIDSPEAQEYLVAITGYLHALRGLAPAQRETEATALERLLVDVGRSAAASPTTLLWLGLWRGELEAQTIEESCGKTHACLAQANRARGMSNEALAKTVGPRTALLLRRSILPVGGAEIDLRYEGKGALSPRVEVGVSFPMVQVPGLSVPE